MLADSSSGRITPDASLLPLRAFDQHYGLRRDLAQLLSDPPEGDHVGQTPDAFARPVKALPGTKTAIMRPPAARSDVAVRRRQKLGETPDYQTTLGGWEDGLSTHDLLRLNERNAGDFHPQRTGAARRNPARL